MTETATSDIVVPWEWKPKREGRVWGLHQCPLGSKLVR